MLSQQQVDRANSINTNRKLAYGFALVERQAGEQRLHAAVMCQTLEQPLRSEVRQHMFDFVHFSFCPFGVNRLCIRHLHIGLHCSLKLMIPVRPETRRRTAKKKGQTQAAAAAG